jgi:hypothetical protein
MIDNPSRSTTLKIHILACRRSSTHGDTSGWRNIDIDVLFDDQRVLERPPSREVGSPWRRTFVGNGDIGILQQQTSTLSLFRRVSVRNFGRSQRYQDIRSSSLFLVASRRSHVDATWKGASRECPRRPEVSSRHVDLCWSGSEFAKQSIRYHASTESIHGRRISVGSSVGGTGRYGVV